MREGEREGEREEGRERKQRVRVKEREICKFRRKERGRDIVRKKKGERRERE